MKSDDLLHLKIKEIHFYKAALLSLIWIGLPTGIQSTMYNASNMFIQASLNTFGTDTMAQENMTA